MIVWTKECFASLPEWQPAPATEKHIAIKIIIIMIIIIIIIIKKKKKKKNFE